MWLQDFLLWNSTCSPLVRQNNVCKKYNCYDWNTNYSIGTNLINKNIFDHKKKSNGWDLEYWFFDNLFFLLVAILGRPLRLAIPFSTSFVFLFKIFMFICCQSGYHKNRYWLRTTCSCFLLFECSFHGNIKSSFPRKWLFQLKALYRHICMSDFFK